jgi:hypothetical protein
VDKEQDTEQGTAGDDHTGPGVGSRSGLGGGMVLKSKSRTEQQEKAAN